MLVATVACGVGLAAVLVVVYRDEPLPVRRTAADWGPLPSPDEVAGTTFPLSFRGYEPGTVDAHLERLRQAYDDLLAVAPPEVVERALERAAQRRAHARRAEHDGRDGPVDHAAPVAQGHPVGQHEPQAPIDPDRVPDPVQHVESLRSEGGYVAADPPEPSEGRGGAPPQ